MKNQTSNYKLKFIIGFSFCLLLVFSNFGCSGLVKNPFREYSEKPFNSAEWLGGDEVERGRMYGDLFSSRAIDGKSKDDVIKLLGEPEKKITVEGRDVWLYHVEHQYKTPMKYFPVTFDNKKGAFAGRVLGGTFSLLAKG